MRRIASPLPVFVPAALAALLSACSGADAAPEDGSSTEDVRSAFSCELTSGATSDDPSGDGRPRRVELRRRPKDRRLVDASLLGDWDLANPPSRGLPRECELRGETASEDLLLCRAEPEWNHFETTSTLRIPKGALDRVAPFELVYHAAKDDRRTQQGFREWPSSKRVFGCKR